MNNESINTTKRFEIGLKCDKCVNSCLHKRVVNNSIKSRFTQFLTQNKLTFVLCLAFNVIYIQLNSIFSTLYLFLYNTIKSFFNRLNLLLGYKVVKNMDRDSDEAIDNNTYNMTNLIRTREHHKKSFDLISKALKIDERIEDKNIGLY